MPIAPWRARRQEPKTPELGLPVQSPPPAAEQEAATAAPADRAAPSPSPVRRPAPAAATEAPTPPRGIPATNPYGSGSALPLEDGSAPSPEYTIKGNASSKLFHTPSSPYYGRTIAEVWFRTEDDANRAGFTGWVRKSKVNPSS